MSLKSLLLGTALLFGTSELAQNNISISPTIGFSKGNSYSSFEGKAYLAQPLFGEFGLFGSTNNKLQFRTKNEYMQSLNYVGLGIISNSEFAHVHAGWTIGYYSMGTTKQPVEELTPFGFHMKIDAHIGKNVFIYTNFDSHFAHMLEKGVKNRVITTQEVGLQIKKNALEFEFKQERNPGDPYLPYTLDTYEFAYVRDITALNSPYHQKLSVSLATRINSGTKLYTERYGTTNNIEFLLKLNYQLQQINKKGF